jgi:hypothetical protein
MSLAKRLERMLTEHWWILEPLELFFDSVLEVWHCYRRAQIGRVLLDRSKVIEQYN